MNRTVDPSDPLNHDKPLWVIYGASCMPRILCCKLRAYTVQHQLVASGLPGHHVCIWGYSVYRRSPGFRTLGIELNAWSARYEMAPLFFDELNGALDHLRTMLTPKDGAS